MLPVVSAEASNGAVFMGYPIKVNVGGQPQSAPERSEPCRAGKTLRGTPAGHNPQFRREEQTHLNTIEMRHAASWRNVRYLSA